MNTRPSIEHTSSTLRTLIGLSVATAGGLASTPATQLHAQGTQLLRQPTVSADAISFVHANDLWVVGREGGVARRITTAEGGETDPKFSPDGSLIAFTGQYSGNRDVYVVPTGGGEPVRLTWHPGQDVVQGWTPDGSAVVFRSGRMGQPTRLWTFYTVPTDGGLPGPMVIPQAYDGEISADGRYVAYQEIGFWDPEWRNHRGGQAKPISVVDLETHERIVTPRDRERHTSPVWMNGKVYYLSEADWANNVWGFDPGTGETEQLTFHWQFDVKDLDAGDGVIVYEQGGYLHELDPTTRSTRQLEIEVRGDLNYARPRWEDVPAQGLQNASLSPTGQRALFEHRGEILTVPVEEGTWRNLTGNSGAAERYPTWSTDGQRIAWFSDESGEYQLMISDQMGVEPPRVIPIPDPTFFFRPVWAPGDAHIAFTDTDMRLLVLDLETEQITHIDTERYAHPDRSMQPVWSPDGKWIAYTRRLDSQLRAIFAWNIETGEKHQLTDGMADAISPVWDASGDYLWFLASTDVGLGTGWLDMSSYDHNATYALYFAILEEDGASPLLPETGDEPAQTEGDADEGDDEARSRPGEPGGREGRAGRRGSRAAAGTPDPVNLDVAGIERRIVAAPIPVRRYTGLVPGPEGSVFVTELNITGGGGGGFGQGGPRQTLRKYAFDAERLEDFGTVQFATASYDRSKLLTRQGESWQVIDSNRPPRSGGASARLGGGGPGDGGSAAAGGRGSGDSAGNLDVSDVRILIDPKAEWAQLLHEGWRYMRDFLYVDNQHGAPWDEIWEWYGPWIKDVRHRSDLNYVVDIISGEISIGHSYVRGGDYPDLDDVGVGLLGADLEREDGDDGGGNGVRFGRIFTGESWNPALTAPLAIPGIDVGEGDYLLAVNGVDVSSVANPYELFENTVGRQTRLLVNDQPSREGAREVTVLPVSDERQLRTWAWVEHNRRVVDELSDGQLAYVWLPNTGQGGYRNFNRMYFAQQHKKGAVIDERNNGGGSAADYIVDVLARDLHGYFNSAVGDHRPWTQPMAGLFGPKVMIVNGRAGSGGDLMPYLFSLQEVGPLIGTRTWGGLVGTWDTPPLLDGGRFVAPRGGFYDVDGNWAVEAEGVEPDVWVEQEPAAVIGGGDPQLEAAVDAALHLLETEAVEFKPEPPAPIRWRRPARRATSSGGNGHR